MTHFPNTMIQQLPISFVAAQIGVSSSTLRKWESRYGFPLAARTSSGVRYYSPQQLEDLKQAMRLIRNGHKPSRLFQQQGKLLLKLMHQKDPRPDQLANKQHPSINRILRALKNHDLQTCQQEIENTFAELELEKAIDQVLAPLLLHVGEAWYRGDILVYQEHAFSKLFESVISSRCQSDTTLKPTVLLATPSGERHVLALMLVRLALTRTGMHCIDLGADLPTDELLQAANDYRADILCLSLSSFIPRSVATTYLERLLNQLPDQVSIWVGGQGAQRLILSDPRLQLFISISEAYIKAKTLIPDSPILPDSP